MPKAAIFFVLLLLPSSLTANSHAFVSGDFFYSDNQPGNSLFDSEIIDVDPNFFSENFTCIFLNLKQTQNIRKSEYPSSYNKIVMSFITCTLISNLVWHAMLNLHFNESNKVKVRKSTRS